MITEHETRAREDHLANEVRDAIAALRTAQQRLQGARQCAQKHKIAVTDAMISCNRAHDLAREILMDVDAGNGA